MPDAANLESAEASQAAAIRVAALDHLVLRVADLDRAIKFYGEKVKKSEAVVRETLKEFYPKASIDPDRVEDIDKVMADAIALKFLDAPLTKEQLAQFFQLQKK